VGYTNDLLFLEQLRECLLACVLSQHT